MASQINAFNKQMNALLDPLMQPPVKSVLVLLLFLYGGLVSSPLPASVTEAIQSAPVRVAIISVAIYMGNKNPAVAIALAFAFLMTLHLTNTSNVESFEGPKTAIYPGCSSLNLYDLLESFNNDKDSLLNAMRVSRVPGNVTLSDDYAPLIATYLLNHGFTLKNPCKMPTAEEQVGIWGYPLP